MHRLTRRDVLRASAGAAAAVPVVALGVDAAEAAPNRERRRRRLRRQQRRRDAALLERAGHRPVMLAIHDPGRGELSILRGTNEVVVKDRRLVARVLRATHAHGRQLPW